MLKHLLAAALALVACAALAAPEVNRADQASLEKVKGIGVSLSGRILQARKLRPFRDWNDLIRRVPGIGITGAIRLSAQGLTVNGLRYEDEE